MAVCILNKELTVTIAKLKEESRLREEMEKAKLNLVTELTTLRGQVDKAKADTVVEFRVSQPFYDAYSVYYGEGFDECFKQVESVPRPGPIPNRHRWHGTADSWGR